MKKMIFAGCLMAGASVFAQAGETDSLKVVNLQEVQIVSTRATSKTPVAFTNVSKEELKKQNFGQDIPFLLSMTPSALTTSDAGAGIGYTTLRVRGTDGTRINITANGIPMNDAESHTLFWVNMPDFASSVKDIQVQRGAGTSTNGAGAFGASVNMQTEGISMQPYAEINASYGSFNAHKETVKFGTGLLKDHWAFDARLSNIGTDGYIDRASVDLYSFYAQGGYFADNTSVKFITFGGKEKTYHAWNYATKEEMKKYGRRFNSCGMYTDDDGHIRFYKDQTDNYLQMNYQLLLNHTFSAAWNLNAALHYTKGDGYYQEYKEDRSLKEYRLHPFMYDGKEVEKSDLIRQKKMDNHFGGGVFSVNYRNEKLDASLGGALNYYDGWHFGRVIWVKNYIGELLPDHEYYRNKAKKTDGNLYLKANYNLVAGLNAYADLQYRYINYKIHGDNDKYDYNTDGLQKLAVNDHFNFFNPKAGLNWDIDSNNRVYASFSVAQKEPTRNNYTDGNADEYPKAEKLYDYELGYTYRNTWLSAGVNFYYMDYDNQLAQTGQLSDIGEALTTNIKDSYRMGVELTAGWAPLSWLSVEGNAALSKNKIKDFDEYVSNWEDDKKPGVVHYDNSTLSYSPSAILNGFIDIHYAGFSATWHTNFVSRQYITNTEDRDFSLPCYSQSDLSLNYSAKVTKTLGIKEISFGVDINNIFNRHYAASAFTWSNATGYGYTLDKRFKQIAYIPMADTTWMTHLTLKF